MSCCHDEIGFSGDRCGLGQFQTDQKSNQDSAEGATLWLKWESEQVGTY